MNMQLQETIDPYSHYAGLASMAAIMPHRAAIIGKIVASEAGLVGALVRMTEHQIYQGFLKTILMPVGVGLSVWNAFSAIDRIMSTPTQDHLADYFLCGSSICGALATMAVFTPVRIPVAGALGLLSLGLDVVGAITTGVTSNDEDRWKDAGLQLGLTLLFGFDEHHYQAVGRGIKGEQITLRDFFTPAKPNAEVKATTPLPKVLADEAIHGLADRNDIKQAMRKEVRENQSLPPLPAGHRISSTQSSFFVTELGPSQRIIIKVKGPEIFHMFATDSAGKPIGKSYFDVEKYQLEHWTLPPEYLEYTLSKNPKTGFYIFESSTKESGLKRGTALCDLPNQDRARALELLPITQEQRIFLGEKANNVLYLVSEHGGFAQVHLDPFGSLHVRSGRFSPLAEVDARAITMVTTDLNQAEAEAMSRRASNKSEIQAVWKKVLMGEHGAIFVREKWGDSGDIHFISEWHSAIRNFDARVCSEQGHYFPVENLEYLPDPLNEFLRSNPQGQLLKEGLGVTTEDLRGIEPRRVETLFLMLPPGIQRAVRISRANWHSGSSRVPKHLYFRIPGEGHHQVKVRLADLRTSILENRIDDIPAIFHGNRPKLPWRELHDPRIQPNTPATPFALVHEPTPTYHDLYEVPRSSLGGFYYAVNTLVKQRGLPESNPVWIQDRWVYGDKTWTSWYAIFRPDESGRTAAQLSSVPTISPSVIIDHPYPLSEEFLIRFSSTPSEPVHFRLSDFPSSFTQSLHRDHHPLGKILLNEHAAYAPAYDWHALRWRVLHIVEKEGRVMATWIDGLPERVDLYVSDLEGIFTTEADAQSALSGLAQRNPPFSPVI